MQYGFYKKRSLRNTAEISGCFKKRLIEFLRIRNELFTLKKILECAKKDLPLFHDFFQIFLNFSVFEYFFGGKLRNRVLWGEKIRNVRNGHYWQFYNVSYKTILRFQLVRSGCSWIDTHFNFNYPNNVLNWTPSPRWWKIGTTMWKFKKTSTTWSSMSSTSYSWGFKWKIHIRSPKWGMLQMFLLDHRRWSGQWDMDSCQHNISDILEDIFKQWNWTLRSNNFHNYFFKISIQRCTLVLLISVF